MTDQQVKSDRSSVDEEAGLEYRICWSASSNINFRGATDWDEWGGDPQDKLPEIERQLCDSGGPLADGLEMALEASGFDWWVEVR